VIFNWRGSERTESADQLCGSWFRALDGFGMALDCQHEIWYINTLTGECRWYVKTYHFTQDDKDVVSAIATYAAPITFSAWEMATRDEKECVRRINAEILAEAKVDIVSDEPTVIDTTGIRNETHVEKCPSLGRKITALTQGESDGNWTRG